MSAEPTVAALAPLDVPGSLVRPSAPTGEIAQAFQDYKTLCSQLLDKDDYQTIGSREFPKKSAWRKLAVAFGVSCSYLERNYERDDQGRILAAEIIVRATAPNGRYMDGLGLCSIYEKRYSNPDKNTNPYHDIPATAATRATNRACADLFGMGEISAEEVVDPGPAREVKRVSQAGPPGRDATYVVDAATGEIAR